MRNRLRPAKLNAPTNAPSVAVVSKLVPQCGWMAKCDSPFRIRLRASWLAFSNFSVGTAPITTKPESEQMEMEVCFKQRIT